LQSNVIFMTQDAGS